MTRSERIKLLTLAALCYATMIAVTVAEVADAEPRTSEVEPTRLSVGVEGVMRGAREVEGALYELATEGAKWGGWPPRDSTAMRMLGWEVDTTWR